MIKTQSRLKYALFATVFVVSTIATQFVNVPFASAATKTWDGGGSDNNWSTAANWNGDTIPSNGDIVTFNTATATGYETTHNNISSLSLGGILYTGATDDGGYAIDGSATLTLTGDVTSTAAYDGSPDILEIDLPIALGANITVRNASFNGVGRTLQTNGYTINVSGTAGCVVVAALVGAGTLQTASGSQNIVLQDGATSYTGNIVISSGKAYVTGPSALGTSAGTTTVQGSGSLSFYSNSPTSTWAEPLVLSGSGAIGIQHGSSDGCGGSAPTEKYTGTFTGPVTLLSNFLFNGSDNMNITGTYNANGHTFTTASGASGTLTTPEGSSVAPVEETTYSDEQPGTSLNVSANQTAIVTGSRGNVDVSQGGTVKGTGTVEALTIIGGTVAPGLSPGTLTVLENLYLSDGSTYAAELKTTADGEYDQIRVSDPSRTGSSDVQLDAGALLNLSPYEGYSINEGDQFTIIDNLQAANIPINGTFAGLDEGSQFVVEGITFSISYVGGDGNDVVITALNAGTDPDAPNTGAAKLLLGNPALLAGLGIITAGLLGAIALRRRNATR